MTTMTEKTEPTRRPIEPLQAQLSPGQAVKIIGQGGVGSIVARYGCTLLAALGGDPRVVLVDGDLFEPANQARMLFRSRGNKARINQADILEYLGDSRLTIDTVEEYVTPENIARIVHNGDIVILTVDNHASRKLFSDFCEGADTWPGLDDVCLISGGNDGVGPDSTGRTRLGTYGSCQVFVRRGGRNLTPSLTHFHPEIRKPADKLPSDLGCLEELVSVPQLLPANLMVASAILNTLWLYLCEVARYSELAFDIYEGRMQPVPLPTPNALQPDPPAIS